jgi:hypothetical protein
VLASLSEKRGTIEYVVARRPIIFALASNCKAIVFVFTPGLANERLDEMSDGFLLQRGSRKTTTYTPQKSFESKKQIFFHAASFSTLNLFEKN